MGNEKGERYWKFILSLLGIFIFLALIDVKFDDPFKATDAFWLYVDLYWIFAYALVIVMGLTYFLITRDKSESVAFMIAFVILEKTGLEDVIYYMIKQQSLPMVMDHLMKHPVISVPAKTLGLSTVTPLSLMISVIIGILVATFVAKKLKEI